MSLVEKLKEYNGNYTVDNLPDELQDEVFEWAGDHSKDEVLRSRVMDLVAQMENE